MLDHANLDSQLLGLVWRANKIDHPNGEHDDYANGVTGALWLASKNVAFNPLAVPTGVGGSQAIGTAIRRELLEGSTLNKSISWLNGDYDEPPAKEHEVFRFRWGDDE